VPGIPKVGWEWAKQPKVSPGLHKVLTKAELCATYVRSIALGGGQPEAEGQARGKVDWAGLRVAGLCPGCARGYGRGCCGRLMGAVGFGVKP
jgi:hypothetical protein